LAVQYGKLCHAIGVVLGGLVAHLLGIGFTVERA